MHGKTQKKVFATPNDYMKNPKKEQRTSQKLVHNTFKLKTDANTFGRMNFENRKAMKKIVGDLGDLEKGGQVEPTRSDWAATLLLV